MKSLSLVSQFLVLGLAIAIVFLYTQPTLENIGSTQSQITQYKSQQAKISKVNADLAGHIATIESISQQNVSRLVAYAPVDVDSIAVMRDIELMAEQVGLTLSRIEQSSVQEAVTDQLFDETPLSSAVDFTIEVTTTYEQLKQLLALFAQNAYPLEVHEMTVDPLEGGFIVASIQLVTYEGNTPADNIDSNIE